MMNKSELKNLINSIHQIKEPSEENIFSYLMGFSEEEIGKKIGETRNDTFLNTRYQFAQRCDDTAQTYALGFKNRSNGKYTEFIQLVKDYLSKTYSIDNYNSWIEQIDHYAFIKEINWIDGFHELLNEIFEKGSFTNKQEEPPKTISFTKLDLGGEEIKQLTINQNFGLKINDIIELADLIGNDYQKTKYYDMSIRNPSWELFYPSEKDFKYVKFFHENKNHNLRPITYSRVWRIFSGFASTILSIKKRRGKYYLYTEIFEIDLEGALKENEFILSTEKELPINAHDINENITTRFDNYRMELITTEDFLLDFPFQDFSSFRKKWQRYRTRLMVGIGRRWIPINKS